MPVREVSATGPTPSRIPNGRHTATTVICEGVHAPPPIRSVGHQQRPARAECPFPTATPLHPQRLLPIEPSERSGRQTIPRIVCSTASGSGHVPDLALQHQMHAPTAKPTSFFSHRLDRLAPFGIVSPNDPPVDTQDCRRPPLPPPVHPAQMGDTLSLGGGRHNVRDAASINMAVSPIWSASGPLALRPRPQASRASGHRTHPSRRTWPSLWRVSRTSSHAPGRHLETPLFCGFRFAMICSPLKLELFRTRRLLWDGVYRKFE